MAPLKHAFFLASLLPLASTLAYSQHEGHQMPATKPAAADTTRRAAPMNHSQHQGHQMPGMAPADTSHAHMNHAGMNHGAMGHEGMGMNMSHAYSRNLPMNRNGSGTAWNPDNTPMYMWMSHHGPWMVMNHGAVNVRYSRQNLGRDAGQRGGGAFGAPNWFMTMAQRPIGEKGLLNLTAMLSLDPLTESGNGYPLLFQSGEAYKGQPLVDRQHPHDLFSALSVAYTHAFNEDVDLTAYLGYPGEPAIGPVAFMHRISAMPNPDAALGHHWQDATHITFGVATLGLRYKQFKLEGSNFTGREPNEHRYGFDKPRADSWAGRLNWNPTPSLALQVSRAFIKSPEELHIDEDVKRTTASIIQSNVWGDYRYITSALIWGMNQHVADGHTDPASHSVLAETNVQLGKPAVYGRYEFVQKSDEELQIPRNAPDTGHLNYNVHALTLGANYRVAQLARTDLTLGAQATVYRPDADIKAYYGSTPVSAQVYLRLNPSLMKMGQ
ncbi:hypothetical protein J0X19_04065 [Hymenobacter sp. BT186]|uniref:TonB-dependent receptor n=1 Tax=Hymenobacter telluris TaxID=2816474 RepID=A0A939EUA7_9BACT|nr:hypothetical protein [Hymenobacter telluris]MBO0357111.1 hypothetical protein [Hymenobacter telluris]MBW3373138.1 hypothetical protein [Hymenobacter norwichensis]